MASGDLESRVTALEHEVRELSGRVRASEHDAASARVLAGAADRDMTDVRGELREFRSEVRGEFRDFRGATTASFNVLREDFVDLRAHVDRRFAQMDRGFAEMDRGFAEMRGKLDGAAAGQQQIVQLLRALGPDRGDHRLAE